ncbi:hypothetical protein ACFP5Z_04965, partial [Kocuria oceani]
MAPPPVVGALDPELGGKPWQDDPSTWPITSLLANEAVHAAKAQAWAAAEELDMALRLAFFRGSGPISLLHEVLGLAAGCPAVDTDDPTAMANLVARAASAGQAPPKASSSGQWPRPSSRSRPRRRDGAGVGAHLRLVVPDSLCRTVVLEGERAIPGPPRCPGRRPRRPDHGLRLGPR